MALKEFQHLKNDEITMKSGKLTEDTQVLDGEAKGGDMMNGTNETKQYKTASLPTNDLGGENDLNG